MNVWSVEADPAVSTVSYRLFGSLVVTVDGEDLRLSQRRGRNVLAMLLAATATRYRPSD